jgi:uncharacterized membrane protein HdeD (DUF308 family)
MSAWKRWQDWVIVVLGVLLYITPLTVPFVFGGAATATATYTAYVTGVLIAAVGLYLLAKPANVMGEWILVLLGALLVASPFVLGFSVLVGVAYTAWIIGVLTILLAASVILTQRHRPAPAHWRHIRRSGGETLQTRPGRLLTERHIACSRKFLSIDKRVRTGAQTRLCSRP